MVGADRQVSDEAELRAKTRQLEIEHEKRVQKLAAELAAARASGEQTAAEMARLRADADAERRRLLDDHAAAVQSQRAHLQTRFDEEMDRLRTELESTRRGRDLFQAEMDALRCRYEEAMFAVENSVPPGQLAAERERLRSEYESNMKVMREELEAVKTSRTSMEREMDALRANYMSTVQQSASTTASTSTAALLSTSSDNLTDEMKMVSVDSLKARSCRTTHTHIHLRALFPRIPV